MTDIPHDQLVSLVRDSATQVFEMMLGMQLEPIPAHVDTAASLSSNGIVSFIGLAGPWAGTGSISCTAPFACRAASQMMMADYTAVDEEVLDAIAELTNMIIGNVKTALEERMGPMGLSIPTVIYGRNFTSRTLGKQEWTIVPFQMDGETIAIQICLARSREASRPRMALAGHEALQF